MCAPLAPPLTMPFATDIIDVRLQNLSDESTSDVGNGVIDAIISGLSKPPHQRTLPTLLLYTETGLKLYDELTSKATEYYLFGAEEDILKRHGDEIIQAMHSRGYVEGESVVELGAGCVLFPYLIPSDLAADFLFKSRVRRSFSIEMRYRAGKS